MKGYWDDPGRTAETIDSDGWLHSGDLGVMDKDGYVAVVGRLKDMIIRGGENIYPREIEEFLFTHPGIQDAKSGHSARITSPTSRFPGISVSWKSSR